MIRLNLILYLKNTCSAHGKEYIEFLLMSVNAVILVS